VNPKCPVCTAVVSGKIVVANSDDLNATVWWQHISDTAACAEIVRDSKVETARIDAVEEDDEYLPEEYYSPAEEEFRSVARRNPEKIEAAMREESAKLKPPGPKVNEYELELARTRAERNKPTRAPLMIGEEELP
jgi:hypothetical protein